jgi:hypothetical protein
MAESRELTLVVAGRLDERLVERALEAAAESPPEERVRNGLDAMIDIVELDPDEAREALWTLQGERGALERLESCLDLGGRKATLALGAAIQLARAELSSPDPDLRSRTPELLRWLEGSW